MANIGIRVGAIHKQDNKTVHLLGYGTFIGYKKHSVLNTQEVCIRLDNNEIIWGKDCNWAPEARIQAMLKNKKIIDVFTDGTPKPVIKKVRTKPQPQGESHVSKI